MVLKESMNMPLAVLEHIHQAAGGCSWGEIAGTTEHADSMDMTSLLVLSGKAATKSPDVRKKQPLRFYGDTIRLFFREIPFLPSAIWPVLSK